MVDSRVLAAGGILWRDAERRKLVLVHRSRYDDWCLPKGKLASTETFEAAALREVAEETGYAPSILGYAGEIYYQVGGQPKSVIMFEMVPTESEPTQSVDSEEVFEIEWMTPEAASERLTYQLERDLLEAVKGR